MCDDSHMNRRDWSRYREISSQPPEEYVTFGTVGHSDVTPSYARIDNGRVLVEVTLEPSGEEVVAVLEYSDKFTPIRYGDRVVVVMPGGTGTSPAIVAKVTDASQPFPTEGGGVLLTTPVGMPAYGFMELQDGELMAIKTGQAGDFIVTSGGSIWMKVDSADQVLVSARTHIGQAVVPSLPPLGAAIGPGGEVVPGVAMGPFLPAPNTNQTVPPPGTGDPGGLLPADGVVRIKDTIQSNGTIDPDFWAWLSGFVSTFLSWVVVPNDGGAALKAALVAYIAANPVPTQLTSQPASGSRNTCSDE
jgi:hypothetical protein